MIERRHVHRTESKHLLDVRKGLLVVVLTLLSTKMNIAQLRRDPCFHLVADPIELFLFHKNLLALTLVLLSVSCERSGLGRHFLLQQEVAHGLVSSFLLLD